MQEIKLGEIFVYEGVKLKCVEVGNKLGCRDCYFDGKSCAGFNCVDVHRSDDTEVVFILAPKDK